MGRRKKSKIASIGSQTIFNVIGFLFIAVGLLALASFFNIFAGAGAGGIILETINQELINKFGGMAFFAPFVVIMLAGHFFNSKRLKFIKLGVSLGMIMIYVSLLGLLRTGQWGKAIFEAVVADFSMLGGLFIIIITFAIGLVLFLDTSIDVLLIAIWERFIASIKTIKNVFISDHKSEDKNKPEKQEKGNKDQDFIQDKPAEPKIAPKINTNPAPVLSQAAQKDFSMKPIVSTSSSSTWVYPPLTLLHDVSQKEADRGDVKSNADIIEKTLESFGIRARVSEVNFGPTVTQYAIEITMGTKLSKITALSNDLALALAAPTGAVRIEAPIPGRSLVGIEIPNKKPEIVTLKRLLTSSAFIDKHDPLLVPLGLDVGGEAQAATIAKMPHVLIAGTTGSGKSVALNSWITTMIMRTRPDELRMILVDPKQVEMTQYNGIPHLLTDVIVEPTKVVSALRWAVAEMEARYRELASVGVRNLEGFNELETVEKKPYIIFVIDELADLMMYAASEAEDLITKIAQKARAVGIHLVLATQRPSVDVITGLMKANIPSRLAFNVSSMIDSRVIIDTPGAEKLLGKGDMFYLPPDQAKPRRIQGPFITEKEVQDVVAFLKAQVPVVHYTEEITELTTPANSITGTMSGGGGDNDPLFNQAVEIISQFDKASASLLQRRLKVGYARAARMLDELESAGYVGPSEGSKPREVIKRPVAEVSSENI